MGKPERLLTLVSVPGSDYYVRCLDNTEPKRKSINVPISAFSGSGGGTKILIPTDFVPDDTDLILVAEEAGTYTNILDETATAYEAHQLDEFHYNSANKRYDLIPYGQQHELYMQSNGVKWVDEDGVMKPLRWNGSAWEESGNEIPY